MLRSTSHSPEITTQEQYHGIIWCVSCCLSLQINSQPNPPQMLTLRKPQMQPRLLDYQLAQQLRFHLKWPQKQPVFGKCSTNCPSRTHRCVCLCYRPAVLHDISRRFRHTGISFNSKRQQPRLSAASSTQYLIVLSVRASCVQLGLRRQSCPTHQRLLPCALPTKGASC